jgi:hypothetical protein
MPFDISNSSKVVAFSNIGLKKFMMAGQNGGIFFMSLGRSISIVTRYICAKGDVCSICTFVTIHFVNTASTVIRAIGGASPMPGNGEGCVRKGIRRKILASTLVFWIPMDNLG